MNNFTKRYFSLLAVCVLGFVTSISALAASYVSSITDGTYNIINNRASTYLCDNGTLDNGTHRPVVASKSGVLGTDQFLWQVTAKGTGFTVKNVKTGLYLTGISSLNGKAALSATETVVYLPAASITTDNYFNIMASASGTVSYNVTTSGSIVGWTGGTDAGSAWGFTEATSTGGDALEAQLDSILESSSNIVRITSARSGSVLIDASRSYSSPTTISVRTKSSSITESVWDELWVLVKKSGGYMLRNLKTGLYPQIGSKSSQFSMGTSNQLVALEASTATTDAYCINVIGESSLVESAYMNCTQYSTVVGWTGGDDLGSAWKIEGVSGVMNSSAEIKTRMTQIIGYDQPTDGKRYNIINCYTGRYLAQDLTGSTLSTYSTTDRGALWEAQLQDDGSFKLYNVVTQRYASNPGTTASARYLTTVSGGKLYINDIGEYESFYAIQPAASSDYGMYDNTSSSNAIINGAISDNSSQWYFKEASLTDAQIAEQKAEYDEYSEISRNSAVIGRNYLTFFEDNAATQLKSEYAAMTNDELTAAMTELSIPSLFIKQALKIKNNTWSNLGYEDEFRIQDYEVYSHRDYWAGKLQTTAYSIYNNPTGIVLNNRDIAVIFCDQAAPSGTTLQLVGVTGYIPGTKQTITLKQGINIITSASDQMHLFVEYNKENTDAANQKACSEFPTIRINILGGTVNGYFDGTRMTATDWQRMILSGSKLFSADAIDVMGRNVHWRGPASSIIGWNPNDVTRSLSMWDVVIDREFDLMALTAAPDSLKEYGAEDVYEDIRPRLFNNYMLCIANPVGGNPYSTYGYTNYNQSSTLFGESGATFDNFDFWTPGHEIGHHNQGAIHMAATTEVSNNLFSNMLVYNCKNANARTQSMVDIQNYAAEGNRLWTRMQTSNVWVGTYFYWQMYLYFHVLGNDPLFYQKLYRELRQNPLPSRSAYTCEGTDDYLYYALKCCEVTQTDLSKFFEYWGFFEPMDNETVASYSTWHITTTKDQISRTLAKMNAYEKKANVAMMFLDDFAEYFAGTRVSVDSDKISPKKNYVFGDYQTYTGEMQHPTNFVYTKSGNTYTLPSNCANAAGIRVLDASGNLVYFANTRSFTVPDNLADKVDHLTVALTDGTEIPLYAQGEAQALTIYQGGSTAQIRYTNGEDEAMISDERDGQNYLAYVDFTGSPLSAEKQAEIQNTRNVVVNGEAVNVELGDGEPFFVPTAFKAQSLSYSRELAAGENGFNLFTLPFAVSASQFASNRVKIETLKSLETDDSGVATVTLGGDLAEIPAGKPVFVYAPDVTDLSVSLTDVELAAMRASSFTKVTGDAVSGTDANGSTVKLTLQGTYGNVAPGASRYTLDEGTNELNVTTSATTVAPFRAYIQASKRTLGDRILIKSEGQVTGISTLDMEGVLNADAPIYDVAGRRVLSPSKGGVYIQNGRKVIWK